MTKLASNASLSPGQLEERVGLALEEARNRGVDQAEVSASHDQGLVATARLGDVENLEYTSDRGIAITVYKNFCKGSASTSDTSPAAIREAVAKACTFAEVTAADQYAGLADAELMCTEIKDLDLEHPWAIDATEAVELAIKTEAAALQFDKRISNSEGATVSTNHGARCYGNTHGFIGTVSRTSRSSSESSSSR